VTVIVRNVATGRGVAGRDVGDGTFTVANIRGHLRGQRNHPTGFQQTSPAPLAVTPTSGQNVTGVNFANATLARIAGHVYQDVGRNAAATRAT